MPALPPLNALRAFEAAARAGGLKAAAEELSVTPAAVGQQVRQLEEILGAKLFERRGRTLVLTERGAAGLERLSRALDLMGEASAAMRAGEGARTLTLAAPAELMAGWLAPRLAGLARTHPDIAVTLAAPGAEGADLSIVYAADPPPGQTAERLMGETLTPAAAPEIAAGIKSPGDLSDAPLIHDVSPGAQASGVDWRGWLASRGAYGVDARGGARIADSMAALAAAAGGAGVVLARRSLAADLIARGRLAVLFADGDMTSNAAWRMISPAGRARSSAARDAAAWLRGEAAAYLDAADEL